MERAFPPCFFPVLDCCVQEIMVSFAQTLFGVFPRLLGQSIGNVTEENGWTTRHEAYWPRGIMRLRGPGNDFPKLS